jgi:hypothetical protein
MNLSYVTYSHSYADTGEVFYFGSGLESRAFDIWTRSKAHKFIIKTRGIKVDILSKFETKADALALEQRLINENYDKLELLNYPPEKWKELGRRSGEKTFKEKTGVHGRSEEKIIQDAKAGALAAKEKGVAIFGLTFTQLSEQGKKGGKLGGKKGGASVGTQRWRCDQCGFVTTPGALGTHQSKLKHVGKTRLI